MEVDLEKKGIGKRIKKLRKLNGLSRGKLGEKVYPDKTESSSTQIIRRIEDFNQKASEDDLRRIAGALNISYEELAGKPKLSIVADKYNEAKDEAIDGVIEEKIDHLVEMLQVAYKTKDYKTMAMLCGRTKDEIDSFYGIESEGED
jgi:transcriptional regulator with XRE-family HTH domain